MSATAMPRSTRDKRLSLVSRILRWATLGSLLAFVIAATALHTLGYVGPSIHALCPYGGLESMLSLVAVGTFLKRIVIGTFVLFGSTILLSIAMRRSFCGQICALGALQEFFGKIGHKLFKKRPAVPQKLDRILRYLKYVVLAVTVAMAWITGELWITPYDPFNALGHLADFNALVTSYLLGRGQDNHRELLAGRTHFPGARFRIPPDGVSVVRPDKPRFQLFPRQAVP